MATITREAARVRAMQEILADMEAGRVPDTVARFADLHDYVDANEYGGLCDDDLEVSGEAYCHLAADVQADVDLWLRARAVAASR